jgi:Mn-dependent DtxR family transcriptional regulator
MVMSVTRRAVLERLARTSDAEQEATTTTTALAASLDTDEHVVESHVDSLAACELVRTYPDGRVRITITGEELLALDIDDTVVVDADSKYGHER